MLLEHKTEQPSKLKFGISAALGNITDTQLVPTLAGQKTKLLPPRNDYNVRVVCRFGE